MQRFFLLQYRSRFGFQKCIEVNATTSYSTRLMSQAIQSQGKSIDVVW